MTLSSSPAATRARSNALRILRTGLPSTRRGSAWQCRAVASDACVRAGAAAGQWSVAACCSRPRRRPCDGICRCEIDVTTPDSRHHSRVADRAFACAGVERDKQIPRQMLADMAALPTSAIGLPRAPAAHKSLAASCRVNHRSRGATASGNVGRKIICMPPDCR